MKLHTANGSYEIPLTDSHQRILGSLGRTIYQELDDTDRELEHIDYLNCKGMLEVVESFIQGKGSVTLYRLSEVGLQVHRNFSDTDD